MNTKSCCVFKENNTKEGDEKKACHFERFESVGEYNISEYNGCHYCPFHLSVDAPDHW